MYKYKPANMPSDYEPCGDCGFDHSYEYEQAYAWHNDRQFLQEEDQDEDIGDER